MAADQINHRAVDVPLQIVLPTLGRQLALIQRFRPNHTPIDQLHLDAMHMLPRRPPVAGIHAAGIVADHAADGGPIGCGGIRRKAPPKGAKIIVQIILNDARLHPHPASRLVIVKNAIALAEIKNNTLPNSLTT